MPTFRKAPPALLERFEELAGLVEADRKLVFGSPACLLRGNMFLAVHDDYVVLRLAEDDRSAFLGRHTGARVFEPMAGRPMKEYVVAPESLLTSDEMTDWVRRSFAYAEKLPAKAAKPPKKKA